MHIKPPKVPKSPEASSRQRARDRAVALASENGRSAHDVLKEDWEQAKWEVSDSSDPHSTQMPVDTAPCSIAHEQIIHMGDPDSACGSLSG